MVSRATWSTGGPLPPDLAAALPKPPPQERDISVLKKLADAPYAADRAVRGLCAAPPGEGGDPVRDTPLSEGAVRIRRAGVSDANGIYRATARELGGAAVFEHCERGSSFKITRKATVGKTGKTKHGWCLWEGSSVLYGAPTESLLVPSSGWRKFEGCEPVPEVCVFPRVADAFHVVAQEQRAASDAAFRAGDSEAALAAVTLGLQALDRSGDRFGEPFESIAAQLFSVRAAVNISRRQWRSTLLDAVAALELAPGLEGAADAAEKALVVLGCPDDATARRLLLEEAGRGRILDRGAPLSLRAVERWVDAMAARQWAPAEAPSVEPPAAQEESGLKKPSTEVASLSNPGVTPSKRGPAAPMVFT